MREKDLSVQERINLIGYCEVNFKGFTQKDADFIFYYKEFFDIKEKIHLYNSINPTKKYKFGDVARIVYKELGFSPTIYMLSVQSLTDYLRGRFSMINEELNKLVFKQ